jgi:hypothetical protein
MSPIVRTSAVVLSLVVLSHAGYVAGQHWWQHALRQPVVLAEAAPRQPLAVGAAHTGVPVQVSLAAPVGR